MGDIDPFTEHPILHICKEKGFRTSFPPPSESSPLIRSVHHSPNY
uniref:Uncharacterized protein n=1 Tax=Anguilla anguilla TaxID=7936 RepID=A0A0E9Q109_ANGAN